MCTDVENKESERMKMAFCAKYCYLFILAVVYFNVSLFDSV